MTHELDSLETFTEPQQIGPQAQLTVGPCLGQLGGLHPQTLRVFGPGQSFSWRTWRHPQTVRLSGPRQSFTFIRSMSCTTGRHPQTLRGSSPRRSFKFRRSMPWKAWRSTSTNSQSVWPQTELQVQTAHVFYNLETPTDPQRVWPQTELQVQTVHVLDNLEVYIHKLSEHLVPGRELPDPPRLGTD